jgi:arginyl-tRNA synthetase
MNIFVQQIADSIKECVDLEKEQIESLIEIPPDSKMGDYAFPCFQLSKTMRKAPNAIAAELAPKIQKTESIERVEAAGGYLNFYMNKLYLSKTVLEEVLKKGYSYGSSSIGQGKNIVIDFSATNIAKPFHIGHLPSTVIGNSLYKIYQFLGYNCVGVNHLGDWGTQFGKLIVAYKKWGDKEIVEKDPIRELVKLYVKFHQDAEKNPSLEDEGRAAFKAIEDGQEEYVQLWKWFTEVSLEEFNRVYGILNISFDSYAGESFYNDKMEPVLKELEDKKLLIESQGAKVVDLESYGMPPCIVQRSDGASLYATRDLAAMFYRKNTYSFDKVLYVVALQQNLHFKQLFKVIELMGHEWHKDLVHVNFGMVSLETGAMSTRKGNVVYLETVLNEAVEKVSKIIEERNFDTEQKEEVAKKVGVGAVIFSALANGRIKDVVFSYEKILNFEGETCPYIQYTFARICSIFRKAENNAVLEVDYSLLNDENSIQVITLLGKFQEVVTSAAEKYEPSFISRYLIDLSQAFNKFYYFNPILSEEENLKNARLAVCKATKDVIETGMGLLGIECPERM